MARRRSLKVHRPVSSGATCRYEHLSYGVVSSGNTRTISGITAANPGVVTTTTAHGLETGDMGTLSGLTGGWAALNGQVVEATVINATSFSIMDTTMLGAPFAGAATITYDVKRWNNVTHGVTTGSMVSSVASWPTFAGSAIEETFVANNAELEAITNCTLETWVKWGAIGGSQLTIGKWKTFGGIYTSGTTLYFYDPNGAAGRSTGETLANGNWYHLVLCCTNGAPGSATMYVNGSSVATAAWTKKTNDYQWPLQAGQFPGFWFLNGQLDTCRLYNRVLGADEILRNYHRGMARHQ